MMDGDASSRILVAVVDGQLLGTLPEPFARVGTFYRQQQYSRPCCARTSTSPELCAVDDSSSPLFCIFFCG